MYSVSQRQGHYVRGAGSQTNHGELEFQDERICTEIKDHIDKFGLKNIRDVLHKNLDGWNEKPLNIGVTGMSGKGKSSLINALRNVEEGSKDAAKVGEEECTTDCIPYPYPKQKNIVFWDLPGTGTSEFRKETYLEQINVDRYDFFLIVSSERFSEIDSWLAEELRQRKKRYYFIRTKADVDMANIKRRLKENFLEQNEFNKLKREVKGKLEKDFGGDLVHFFMISNYDVEMYDFPMLRQQLLDDAPNEKKMAMINGIPSMLERAVEEKATTLGLRIHKQALFSGAAALIPIPFVSGAIDIGVILEEVLFYRSQFALDDESLGQLAMMARISLAEFKTKVRFKTPEGILTGHGLRKFLTRYVTSKVAETIAKFTLPVVGSVISCGASYAATKAILQDILDSMKTDVISVLLYLIKHVYGLQCHTFRY